MDIRPIVQKLTLRENGSLEMELKPTDQRIPKVGEIIGGILQLSENQKTALVILK